MRAKKGISINGEIHTANDLDMILKIDGSSAQNPEPKLLIENIHGRNGVLDLSDWCGGIIFFENRPVSYKFFICGTREEVRRAIERLNRFHGRTIAVVEDDDPDFSLTGRADVVIEEMAPYGNYAYLTLTLDAEPYRKRLTPTVREFADIIGTRYEEIGNNVMPVQLTVKVNSLTGTSQGYTYGVSIADAVTNVKQVVRTVGQSTAITAFLLKGGVQRVRIETVRLADAATDTWITDNTLTATVTVSYTEGQF